LRQLSVLRKKFRSAAADGWSSKSPCWLRLRRNWPQFEGPNCHGKAVITDAKCIPARNVAQRPVAGGVDRLLRIGNYADRLAMSGGVALGTKRLRAVQIELRSGILDLVQPACGGRRTLATGLSESS